MVTWSYRLDISQNRGWNFRKVSDGFPAPPTPKHWLNQIQLAGCPDNISLAVKFPVVSPPPRPRSTGSTKSGWQAVDYNFSLAVKFPVAFPAPPPTPKHWLNQIWLAGCPRQKCSHPGLGTGYEKQTISS